MSSSCYATVEQFKARKRVDSADSADDGVIQELLDSASGLVNTLCGRWFYAAPMTRYFGPSTSIHNGWGPWPGIWSGRQGSDLLLDEDLLSVTSITGPDGVVLTAPDYTLLPRNTSPKYAIRLASATSWGNGPTGDEEIAIAGQWGYVDRDLTAPSPAELTAIVVTCQAALDIALMKYAERFGPGQGGPAIVTGAGVVITPQGAVPKSAWEALRPYVRTAIGGV
jgi:hypothetical protein